jgi:hypothetical protein
MKIQIYKMISSKGSQDAGLLCCEQKAKAFTENTQKNGLKMVDIRESG